ncbi:MerR family transcriptional regulator [Antarctobacter sp.]|uniref:MerR family transcriptional regulator n=1 Tax=Antarctobacter sp. TaxID=1872577 RepID=UPI003A95C583
MPKSRDAFRTISEVADWLETPAHVLRFWESKFSQVKPVKRAGGRRYYRPADMELLGGIKKLLHDDGMTIKGVQKVLREQGVRHVASLAAQSAEADQSDLIEDAPYAEVPLHDTEAEVVAFPSEAVVMRADDTLTPQTVGDAPEQEADALEPAAPDLPDSVDVDPPQTAPEAPAAQDLSVMADAAEGFENIQDDTTEEADLPMPEALDNAVSESPVHHCSDSQQIEASQQMEAEPSPAAKETPEESGDHGDTELAIDTALPQAEVDAAPSSGPSDSPPEREPADTPELPFDIPAAAPVADDGPAVVADPETESKARNPLDLPDFSISETPPPVAEPVVRPAIGPLGQIAKLSSLSEAQKAALAAQLPALEALRDRLSAPLS